MNESATNSRKESGMSARSLFVTGVMIFSVMCAGWPMGSSASANDKIPTKSDQSCLKCHEYDKQANLFAGKFKGASVKANCLQIQIDKGLEVITFDDETVVKNASSVPEIPKEESVRVLLGKKDGKTYAKEVEVKKGLAVPAEQLMTTEQVAELVAKGPEKGKYILLDSRPMERYNEGHIPTAVGMPFFAFDKLAEKLLRDKDTLQIYYCSGYS